MMAGTDVAGSPRLRMTPDAEIFGELPVAQ